VEQTSATTSSGTPAEGQQESPAAAPQPEPQPGFSSRGRARRRARFLRKARELAYRDLGGLVYNLHRFGQRNDALVLGKLSTLGHIDSELRTIEGVLRERRPVTVLREAGITACPRCAAIHGSEDRYCPNCGLPMDRHADLPIAGAPAGAPDGVPAAPSQAQQPAAPATAVNPVTASADGSQVPQPTSGNATASAVPPTPQAGRSSVPPARTVQETSAAPQEPDASGAKEESTEILHPRAPGP
jgi:hypothetical protein